MHSRRHFITVAGLAFALPALTTAQMATKRYVHMGVPLQAVVPADWSIGAELESTSLTMIGSDSSWFDAGTFMAESLDAAGEQLSSDASLPEAEFVEGEFRGQPCLRGVVSSHDGRGESAIIVLAMATNDRPVDSEHSRFVALLGDQENFDTIVDSVSFGPETISPAQLAQATLEIVSGHAYYRDYVDLDALSEQALEVVSLEQLNDRFLQGRVISALREAGDNHSFIVPPLSEPGNGTGDVPRPLYPTGYAVDNVGYLRLPSTTAWHETDLDEYAREGLTICSQIANEGVKGWIIDLREMSGGSVSPPLSVLYPFLPDGRLAGFLDAAGQELWIEKAGMTISPAAYQQSLDVEWPVGLDDPTIPVAVLMGPQTASAGEFTLLATMARENLKTFGIPSAGYTTGNSVFDLPSGYRMALATTAELDSLGNIHTGPIEPMMTDTTVGTATGWNEDQLESVLEWLGMNAPGMSPSD